MTKWIAGFALLALAQGVAAQDAIRLKSGKVIRPGHVSRRIPALVGKLKGIRFEETRYILRR